MIIGILSSGNLNSITMFQNFRLVSAKMNLTVLSFQAKVWPLTVNYEYSGSGSLTMHCKSHIFVFIL